jgi:hypothetical protein
MRRVNACPRLDEAGVVVVAARRQDMILSSGALVLETDLPARERTDSNLISLLPSRWALVWRSHKFRYGLSHALFGWNKHRQFYCLPSALCAIGWYRSAKSLARMGKFFTGFYALFG